MIDVIKQAQILKQQKEVTQKRMTIRIQRWYRFAKFIQEINNSSKLIGMLSYYSKPIVSDTLGPINMFDPNANLAKFIAAREKQNKAIKTLLIAQENTQQFHRILVRYYRYVGFDFNVSLPIDNKKLMMAWHFYVCPEDNFNKTIDAIISNPSEYPNIVYCVSFDIVKVFGEIAKLVEKKSANYKKPKFWRAMHETKRKFIKTMNVYSNVVNYYLNTDNRIKQQELVHRYFNICDNIKHIESDSTKPNHLKQYLDEQRDAIIAELNMSLNQTFEMLFKLDKNIKREDIDALYRLAKIGATQAEEYQIQMLVQDMKTNHFVLLNIIMSEIKNMFVILNGHRIPLQNGALFDDLFDSTLLSQTMVESSDLITRVRTFDNTKAFTYGNHMKYLINQLESASSSESTNYEWDALVGRNYHDSFEYFSRILFFIMSKQRRICENIAALEEMTRAGIAF